MSAGSDSVLRIYEDISDFQEHICQVKRTVFDFRGIWGLSQKHYNMIANPHYGLLGLVTMCYQFVIELLGPIFWVIYTVLLIDKNMFPFCSLVFAGYALAQIGLTIFAAYIDTEKNMRSLLRWIPKLILITIEEIVLQIPIMVARVVGMLTFHWRRIVW